MRRLVDRLPHYALGDLDGDLRHLTAELLEDAVAFGTDLALRARDRRLRLLLGTLLQLGAHPVGRLPRLLDDAVRFLARAGDLLAVLLELALGRSARLLRLFELTLDPLTALLEQRVDPRQHPLPHEEEQDGEGDRADDQLLRVRVEIRRVVGLLLGMLFGLEEDRSDEGEHARSPLR